MSKKERKEREITRIRHDILDAAATAFARKGFHGATMEDIAKQAEFAVGTLYNYFTGKGEIYRALLATIAHEFELIYDEPLITLDFRQRLEWLFQKQFEVVEAKREFFVMFFNERVSFDWELGSDVGDFARQQYQNWIQRMVDILSRGIKEGHLRSVDSRDLAYFIIGTINTTILRWISGDLPIPLREYTPIVLDLLFRGMEVRSEEDA